MNFHIVGMYGNGEERGKPLKKMVLAKSHEPPDLYSAGEPSTHVGGGSCQSNHSGLHPTSSTVGQEKIFPAQLVIVGDFPLSLLCFTIV